MSHVAKITFAGNKTRNFVVDDKTRKYLAEIGLYERREGFIGFSDTSFRAYVFPLQNIEAIEVEEQK